MGSRRLSWHAEAIIARARGERFFISARPCPRCNGTKRYACNRGCCSCSAALSKRNWVHRPRGIVVHERQAARLAGMTRFISEKECLRCRGRLRRTSNGRCIRCEAFRLSEVQSRAKQRHRLDRDPDRYLIQV
jgi:hypothetical protein